MLAGHVRDARVGSDVLIGVALGSVVALLEGVRIVGVSAMGQPPPIPALGDQVKMLLGSGALVGQLAYWTYGPLETALFIGLAFVGLRFLLRNDWLAAAATIVVLLFLADNGASISAGSKWYTAFSLLLFVSVLLALLRYGLLVVVVGLVVGQVLTSVPYPARLSTWAAGPFRWALVLVAALMAYGAYAARATSASSAP
jgi:hypothetical protein